MLIYTLDRFPVDHLLPRPATLPTTTSSRVSEMSGPIGLGEFLAQSKADFVAALEADKPMSDWVIVTGNEAGGGLYHTHESRVGSDSSQRRR